MIEHHNPHIQFDWTQILKGQGEPAELPERRERPRPDARPRPTVQPAPPPLPPVEDELPLDQTEARFDAEAGLDAALDSPETESTRSSGPEQDVAEVAPLEMGPADDLDELETQAAPPDDGPVTAAHARLGSEGVSRLRARYADVMAGISDRIQDPERAAELKSQAERLNPDCWVTEDEVREGLERYESVFDSLRSVVGRRRRRRRR